MNNIERAVLTIMERGQRIFIDGTGVPRWFRGGSITRPPHEYAAGPKKRTLEGLVNKRRVDKFRIGDDSGNEYEAYEVRKD